MRGFPAQEVFRSLFDRVSSAEFSRFCMFSWAIWDDRNSLVNNGKAKDPPLLASWVKDFHEEFLKNRAAFSPHPPKPLVNDASDWLAPPPGQLKLNISIAKQRGSNSFGVGSSIRDDKGKVLVARSSRLWGSFPFDVGSFLAVRESLMPAKFYNIPINLVEINSNTVVSSLNSPVIPCDDARFIVSDIKALMYELGSSACLFVSNSGNTLAHSLASLAFSLVRESLWLDFGPS